MRKTPITLDAATVRRMLNYDPVTGELIWKVERYRKHPGDVAGCKHIQLNGYRKITISINYRRYVAARIIWLLVTGEWPDNEIDHRDGDGWNNKWNNLRKATRLQNCRNIGMKKTNTSGIPGVNYDVRRGLFRARITVNRKELWLGYFRSLHGAGRARRNALAAYYGDFART